MFALTEERFDAWIHVHEPTPDWVTLDGFRQTHGWERVYVSLHHVESWHLPHPDWAIAVPTGALHAFEAVAYREIVSYDAFIDVSEGPQRTEDLLIPHQIRVLTSTQSIDVERTLRFLRASEFSSYLWRVTLEDRDTRRPLSTALFHPRTERPLVLGANDFLSAQDVGVEYVFDSMTSSLIPVSHV